MAHPNFLPHGNHLDYLHRNELAEDVVGSVSSPPAFKNCVDYEVGVRSAVNGRILAIA